MPLTLQDLTVGFAHLDRDTLLESWQWLIGPTRLPILVTASGDAFLQDTQDGSVHVLDSAAGEVSPVADSVDELRALMRDPEFVQNFFAVEMVADLREAGITLAPGQVYGYRVPPVLGGEYEIENAEPTDIEVHFHLTGQIHQQVRGLPPGTSVGGARIG